MSFEIPKTLFAVPLLVCLITPATVLAEEGDTDFAYATGLFQKQRWKYAIEALEEFLQNHPDHPKTRMAQLYYGLALNSDERYEPARKTLRDFLQRYPDSRNGADAQFRIAECSYGLKDYPAAIAEFTEYLAAHKDHNLRGWAVLMLGESHNALRQWKQAETALQPLTTSPADQRITPDAFFALGIALQGQRRSADAIAAFNRVLTTKSPALARRAYARIATIHFTDQRYAEADTFYQRIIAEFPNDPMAVTAALQSGIARFQRREYQQALDQLNTVPQSSTARVHAEMWSGLCQREMRDLPAARQSLSAAYKAAGDKPLAGEILFYRAQVEVLAEENGTAAQMFLDLADRWPDNRYVATSLFNAAQLKMELGEASTAERILERLTTEYPEQAESASTLVLRGRLLLTNGDAAQAVTLLETAARQPTSDSRSRLFRHYHLIRALHRDKRYRDTVKTFETIRPALAESSSSEFIGAASLAAMSSLELKDYEKARTFADEFLAVEKRPGQRADALAARAVALSHLRDFEKAQADLSALVQGFRENRQTWVAVLQSAEVAWAAQKWQQAAAIFELATGDAAKSLSPELHQSAVSGAAWSRYRLANFADAAELFRQHYSMYPQSAGAIEAAYMEATCRFDAEAYQAAADLFVKLYRQLESESELPDGHARYLMDSGRMAARLLARSGAVDDADGIWEQLASRFVDHALADSILDAWAFMNLEHERFDRSDEIYRKLLNNFPESQFAGQARLSLAESAMQAGQLDAALSEFQAIVAKDAYGADEKEAALYHIVDLQAADRKWPDVLRHARQFTETFSDSPHVPRVQLLYAEALLDGQKFDEASAELKSLRAGIVDGSVPDAPWTERIWIVDAEIALALRRYADIDRIEQEFTSRSPDSAYLLQMHDIQGRRWKSQASPDFEKSREYLTKVTSGADGQVSETAARCQFLIGETYLLERNYKAAIKAYYHVYLNYPFDEWRARGLFQAAGCELALKDTAAARRSYEDLIRDFPGTELAEKAAAKLAELSAQ